MGLGVELRDEVRSELELLRETVAQLRSQLDQAHDSLLAKTLTTTVAGVLVPGSGELATTIAELRDDRRLRDQRYQGFLVGFKRGARRHRHAPGSA